MTEFKDYKKGDKVKAKDNNADGVVVDFGKTGEILKKNEFVKIPHKERKELGSDAVILKRGIGYLLINKELFEKHWEKGTIDISLE